MEFHGTTVTDPFSWLEQASEPEVVRWTAKQNRAARSYLDGLPTRRAVEHDLAALFGSVDADYSSLKAKGSHFFALKSAPPAQQSVVVQLTSLTNVATEKVVLDPNKLGSPGSTSIDFYEPSPDGKLVAVSLSESGSESGTLHVYETPTGKKLPDTLPRVQFPTAGGSVAWAAGSSGFYYTRYPAPGERPDADLRFYQQVYFHELGTPASRDRYEIGREFPRIAEVELKSSADGRHVLATVSNGDGGDHAHWLRAASGGWRQIARFEDAVKQAEFGRDPIYIEWPRDESIYLLSHRNSSRGRVLKTSLADPSLKTAIEVIPSGTNVIDNFVPSASGIYVSELNGGPSLLRFHNWYAKEPGAPEAETETEPDSTETAGTEDTKDTNSVDSPQAANASDSPARQGSRERGRRQQSEFSPEWRVPTTGTLSVQEMLCPRGDELIFRTVGFTEPYAWQIYNPSVSRNRTERTALRGTAPADFQDVEAVREFATSKDGTRIPLHIVRRKGSRMDGNAPTILTGYGGFGISVRPRFDFSQRIWLDQGGIVAIANLRGGGEFGDEWHRAGNLTRKQNVFDDFIACAEFLIRSNYTSPARLAIQGVSNGGLLVGAALTQRPELFRAVIGKVGVYDMLRAERDPNGEFNTTEFGSVKFPEQFRALYGYSPYHRIQERRAYPATLLMTGEQDGRVNPAHSRKMAARLQAATSSGRPVLLRTQR